MEISRSNPCQRFLDFFKLTPKPANKNPHSGHLLLAKHRDFWWNDDFLDLLQKRIDFTHVSSGLDVGCGRGSWTRKIASLLPATASMTGIDKEEQWIKDAKSTSTSNCFHFEIGDAKSIPYQDNSFDLVTCQTLLMHVESATKVLHEMSRVLKPGGLLVIVEPNNMMNICCSNSAQEELNIDEKLEVMQLHLICQEGKKRSGNGFDTIGPHIAGLLPKDKFVHLGSWMSDKMMHLCPPYQSDDQKALAAFVEQLCSSNCYYIYPKEKAKEYFLAVSTDLALFEKLWLTADKLNRIYLSQLKNQDLKGVVGGSGILTAARKL